MVILGLLKNKPLYGYELKHIIEEHMGDWTTIAFGSIYFALAKLKEERLVEITAEEKKGNRPSRTVYRITDAGRKEFLRLLREQWGNPEWKTYDFDLGLFFSDELPREERIALLRKKIAAMEGILGHLESHRGETVHRPEVPRVARAIFDHSAAHAEAELTWLRNLLQGLEKEK